MTVDADKTRSPSDTSPAEQKKRLRGELRQRRRALPAIEAQRASARCADHFVRTALWHASRHLAVYLGNDGELDPAAIVLKARESGRTLYLPRVHGNAMHFTRWDEGAAMQTNRFGIEEPTGPACPLETLDLILLPLVAWDGDGSRLGMGGGYYDRLLGDRLPGDQTREAQLQSTLRVQSTLPAREGPWLVGMGYAAQRVTTLPREPWDVRLDGVLSEEGLEVCSERLVAVLNDQ